MSEPLPPEPVEQVAEPVPVGLPKSMQNLNRAQMASFIADALRKPAKADPDPVVSQDEQPV